MAETVFNFAKKNIADGTILLTTGSTNATPLYILLVSSSYGAVSDFDDQDYLLTGTTNESIAHHEISSGNMGSSARQALGNTTSFEDDAGNEAEIVSSSEITYSSVSSGATTGGTIGGAVIFAEVAASDSSGRIPIAFYDTNFPVTANGGDITLQFTTGGWLNFTT